MKRIDSLHFLLLVLFSISLISCSDNDDNHPSAGITGQSWTEGTPLEISQGNDLSVSFHAAAKWEASVTSGADWCKLSKTSGTQGQNTLKVSVNGTTTTDRTARISITAEGFAPVRFDVIQRGSDTPPPSEDPEVNTEVDKFLRKMYLWNEEYKTLRLDFAKSYEDFFYDALGSMTTNTLDKKTYIGSDGKTYYTLFSYIQKLPNFDSTRAISKVEKELAYSFGITGITPVSIGTQNDYTTYFCIQGVHPDSPASEAGLKRGAMISLVNGKKITDSNINEYYYYMQLPDAALSYTLTEDVIENGQITGKKKEYPLTAKAMYVNPVIYSKVCEEYEGHRIGYLVYSGFEAGFDEELFNVFKEFKKEHVTDLILDLRYNGGGHTMSANLMSTCVAGAASQGKVFYSLRYNAERMAKLNNKREEEQFAYNNYENLGVSLAAGSLDLPRVYCLVGDGTASSSELVINSLRGIGITVTLIGETTTGKNVGMEVIDLKVKEETYRVAPITFQSYNAQGFGDYEHGFTPDVPMDETNPYNEQSVFYILKEYGSNEEPLYAKAIELITGTNPMPQTRNAANALNGKARKMPAVSRPGHDGMLKPAFLTE